MQEPKTIFTVTVVCSRHIINHRCWGWYHTKEDAWTDLTQNTDLFFESATFDYAVIEELGPGIMSGIDAPSEPEWIRIKNFDPTEHTYELERLEHTPEFAQGMICWGMG